MEQRSGFIAVNVGSLFLSFTTPWINPRILVGVRVVHIFFPKISSVLWCPLRFLHKNDVRFVFISSCL
jgi:hypothetical protein